MPSPFVKQLQVPCCDKSADIIHDPITSHTSVMNNIRSSYPTSLLPSFYKLLQSKGPGIDSTAMDPIHTPWTRGELDKLHSVNEESQISLNRLQNGGQRGLWIREKESQY